MSYTRKKSVLKNCKKKTRTRSKTGIRIRSKLKSRTVKKSRRKIRKTRKDGLNFDWIYKSSPSPSSPSYVTNQSFYEAILIGNLTYIKLLLNSTVEKLDINTLNYWGEIYVPLLLAIKNDKFDVIKLLVEYGANINQADKKGKTPLMLACELKRIEIIKYLKDLSAIGECDIGPAKRLIQPKNILLVEPTSSTVVIYPKESETEFDSTKTVGVIYRTYFDLLTKGLQRGAVENKMISVGINPAILDLDTTKPVPNTFSTVYKKPEIKKVERVYNIGETADSKFWEESDIIVEKILTHDKIAEFKKNYVTKELKLKTINTPTENKIVPLLNIDSKYIQPIMIGYKKIISNIPVGVNSIDYIKNLIKGNLVNSSIDELILGVLSDIIPHTKKDDKTVPDMKEINKILNINKDTKDKIENKFILGYELFIYNILQIDSIYERIIVLQFKLSFTGIIKNITYQLDILNKTFIMLQSSTELKIILHILQKLLSQGGHKGGFSLTTLPTILDYKSTSDKNKTILMFLIDTLTATSNVINFETLTKLSDIVNTTLTYNLTDISKTLSELKNATKLVEKIEDQNRTYENYLLIQKEISLVELKYTDTTNNYIKLLNIYGEPEKAPDQRVYLIKINDALVKLKDALVKISNRHFKNSHIA